MVLIGKKTRNIRRLSIPSPGKRMKYPIPLESKSPKSISPVLSTDPT